jgi:hypothetical protein
MKKMEGRVQRDALHILVLRGLRRQGGYREEGGQGPDRAVALCMDGWIRDTDGAQPLSTVLFVVRQAKAALRNPFYLTTQPA